MLAPSRGRRFASRLPVALSLTPLRRSASTSTLAGALAVPLAALALSACTSVNAAAVKEHESSGVTHRYDRPPDELYEASVAAVPRMRASSSYWNQLEISERDPAKGTVIAEQHNNSAIPGVGTTDAIGIFVNPSPPYESDVTVVVMGSDQIPGSTGTTIGSFPTAESLVFPAIDESLKSIPEKPRQVAAAPAARPAAAPARHAPSAAPAGAPASAGTSAPAPAPGEPVRSVPAAPAAGEAGTLDRLYDALHASGTWRPLVRETRADGAEEIRIGTWATMTDAGDGRVKLRLRDSGVSPAEAARLATWLSQAGFSVDVESEPSSRRGH